VTNPVIGKTPASTRWAAASAGSVGSGSSAGSGLGSSSVSCGSASASSGSEGSWVSWGGTGSLRGWGSMGGRGCCQACCSCGCCGGAGSHSHRSFLHQERASPGHRGGGEEHPSLWGWPCPGGPKSGNSGKRKSSNPRFSCSARRFLNPSHFCRNSESFSFTFCLISSCFSFCLSISDLNRAAQTFSIIAALIWSSESSETLMPAFSNCDFMWDGKGIFPLPRAGQ